MIVLPPLTRVVRSYALLSGGAIEGQQSACGIELRLSRQVDDGFSDVVEFVVGDGA